MPSMRCWPHAHARLLVIMLLIGMVAGCVGSSSQFSLWPGFDRWYHDYPPAQHTPSESEQRLLQQYQPRFFLSAHSEGPIAFYRDYIAHGELTVNGQTHDSVTPAHLNEIRHNPEARFVHHPSSATPQMAVYGRIDHESFPLIGNAPWTYLTYTLIFRSSGLPAGLPQHLNTLLELVADLDDWHQLDNYISVVLALDDARQPTAVTIQQHNYTRTYLLGPENAPGILQFPADGRLKFDIAIRSNELYPHRPHRVHRRAVSFMDLKSAEYLIADGPPPLLAADDITDPSHEITPPMCYLPPADAFYTFRGWLGAIRQLPGASGPPGSDFNTLPAFKPRGIQLVASHWWEGDSTYLDLLAQQSPLEINADNVAEYLQPLVARFTEMRTAIRRNWLPTTTPNGSPPTRSSCPD